MNFVTPAAVAAVLLIAVPAQASTLTVDGALFLQAGGITLDVWRIDMQTAGSLSVDL